MLPIVKAHAYGNDFLYVRADDARNRDAAALARAICARHTGVGADGLILYAQTPRGAAMRLFNADGSSAEVSGNGVRALGAVLLEVHGVEPPGDEPLVIETDAGEKRLTLIERRVSRCVFRASMGQPSEVRARTIEAGGEMLRVATMSVGNPQCVRLERTLSEERLRALGPIIERHPEFPAGTNVEFVHVESPDRLSVLIWERGVGVTSASGTGACAAAVAAAVLGGATRDVTVQSPGGSQRVEWRPEGLFLTGWAEVVFRGEWAG